MRPAPVHVAYVGKPIEGKPMCFDMEYEDAI